jgi:hypothetical protein
MAELRPAKSSPQNDNVGGCPHDNNDAPPLRLMADFVNH